MLHLHSRIPGLRIYLPGKAWGRQYVQQNLNKRARLLLMPASYHNTNQNTSYHQSTHIHTNTKTQRQTATRTHEHTYGNHMQDTSGTPQDWSQNVSISHHPKTEAEAGGRSGMPRPGSEISELGRGPWAGLRGRCSVYHIVVDRLLRHLNECHVNDFYPRLCAMVRTGHGTSKPFCRHKYDK